MPTDTFAGRERGQLCDRFEELGPDAPTLCEGWATLELAAHLFVRERRPIAALGLLGGPLAGVNRRSTERARDLGYEHLVARLRGGPPWPVRPLDGVFNLHELFVHHEDVRRAREGWARREDPGLDDALWTLLRRSTRLLTRRLRGVTLELGRPGGESLRVRRGDAVATLRGTPQEMVLYLFGRRDVAGVALEGDPEAIGTVEGADLAV